VLQDNGGSIELGGGSGLRSSTVGAGGTMDWQIRSGKKTGKVMIQDGGGSIELLGGGSSQTSKIGVGKMQDWFIRSGKSTGVVQLQDNGGMVKLLGGTGNGRRPTFQQITAGGVKVKQLPALACARVLIQDEAEGLLRAGGPLEPAPQREHIALRGAVGGHADHGPLRLRQVALPEVDADFNGDNRSALQMNRQLYRAHRQMRLAVTEASKRFEEQQTRHARNVLLAQEAEKETGPTRLAGLVMRRVENKTVSSEAVKKLLEENRREQQSLMEVASKRGGRGRRTRKKTISDMSGMMGSLSQDDLNKMLPQAVAANGLSSLAELDSQDQANDLVRGATVPGEFKKVSDPFGVHGKYGNAGDQNPSATNEGEVYWL